jgi:hypothetical protein
MNLKLESDRLKTFSNWKKDFISTKKLSEAGFYHVKSDKTKDLVKCAFCEVELCKWEEDDDPMTQHLKWSPKCEFFKGEDVVGYMDYSKYQVRLESFFTLTFNSNALPIKLATAGFYFPKHDYNLDMLPQPDLVVCFKCQGRINNWEIKDEPWEEHALWFPKCPFVLKEKGKKFVKEVAEKFGKKKECICKTQIFNPVVILPPKFIPRNRLHSL